MPQKFENLSLCFDYNKYFQKEMGVFFQILRPSYNIGTLWMFPNNLVEQIKEKYVPWELIATHCDQCSD